MERIKQKLLSHSDKIFDRLYHSIESTRSYKIISTFLVLAFLSGLLMVFLNRMGVFPTGIAEVVKDNYFFAVEVVFRILLAIEIVTMVFVLAYSVSDSIAKQFEILSLILLRQAFKEFSYVELPLDLENDYLPITYMLSDIFGALLIFFGIYIFDKMQKHRNITFSKEEKSRFVSVKKMLALFMIISFFCIGIYDLYAYLTGNETYNFFTLFYTFLIFTDILLVIIALRYSHSYCVVFRNTGFAVATVLIRMSLSMPHYFDAVLGIIAMLFVIFMTLVYNKFEIKRHRKILKEYQKNEEINEKKSEKDSEI